MILTGLLIAALILALVDELAARGRDLVAWSVVIVCAVLVWERLA